jgi:hypothetical protein
LLGIEIVKTSIVILGTVLATSAFAQTKDQAITQYLDTFSQLRTLGKQSHAQDRQTQEQLHSQIERIVSDKLSSEQLFRVGTAAWLASYPQDAGSDIPYDRVLAYASEHCAALLAKRSDIVAVRYLSYMQAICGRGSAERLMYDDLIEQQKKLKQNGR